MKNKVLYSIFALVVISFLLVSAFNVGRLSVTTQNSKQLIDYTGNVCVQVERADGTIEPTECQHNVLYNDGAELIEDYLADGSGGGDAFDWIELCDSLNTTCSEPLAIDETAVFDSLNYTNWTGCGMDEAAGTVGDLGSGNWSIYYEFTSTCPGVTTNVTRLRNADHDVLAGVSFTEVELEINDKVTVNWTITAA